MLLKQERGEPQSCLKARLQRCGSVGKVCGRACVWFWERLVCDCAEHRLTPRTHPRLTRYLPFRTHMDSSPPCGVKRPCSLALPNVAMETRKRLWALMPSVVVSGYSHTCARSWDGVHTSTSFSDTKKMTLKLRWIRGISTISIYNCAVDDCLHQSASAGVIFSITEK